MTRKHADYVYRNHDDSLRVRVFQRETGRWDYDVFHPSGAIKTFSEDAGDNFGTKRDALAEVSYWHGKLTPITITGSITDKAWFAKQQYAKQQSKRTHATIKKSAAQIDAEIAAALAARRHAALRVGAGTFYLAETSPYEPLPGPEFRSRAAAKRAALKLVHEGKHRLVEVWHRWRGQQYMQGLANEDGWSDV